MRCASAARTTHTACVLAATTTFATIMIGQPTLRRMIKPVVLAALDQHIAVRYQMPA